MDSLLNHMRYIVQSKRILPDYFVLSDDLTEKLLELSMTFSSPEAVKKFLRVVPDANKLRLVVHGIEVMTSSDLPPGTVLPIYKLSLLNHHNLKPVRKEQL